MRVFRFLLAAIVVVAAMFTGFFALAIVAVIGLVAMIVQSFRRRQSAGPAPAPSFPRTRRKVPSSATEDVIDVVATEEPENSSSSASRADKGL